MDLKYQNIVKKIITINEKREKRQNFNYDIL